MEIQIQFRGNSKPYTPSESTTVSGKFIRQASGLDRYGHVEMVLEPIQPTVYDSRYSWEVSEDKVPSIYFDSVLEGIKRALESDDVPFDFLKSTKIRIVGGSYNEVDSSPYCYMLAAYFGFRDFLQKAGS